MLHEFIETVLYQFMDEINCEIAHQDIMASGYRKWKCLEALKQESQSIEKIDSLGFFEKVVFVHQCKFTLWKNFIFVILRLRLLKFGVKDSNVFQIILLHIVGVTRTVI